MANRFEEFLKLNSESAQKLSNIGQEYSIFEVDFYSEKNRVPSLEFTSDGTNYVQAKPINYDTDGEFNRITYTGYLDKERILPAESFRFYGLGDDSDRLLKIDHAEKIITISPRPKSDKSPHIFSEDLKKRVNELTKKSGLNSYELVLEAVNLGKTYYLLVNLDFDTLVFNYESSEDKYPSMLTILEKINTLRIVLPDKQTNSDSDEEQIKNLDKLFNSISRKRNIKLVELYNPKGDYELWLDFMISTFNKGLNVKLKTDSLSVSLGFVDGKITAVIEKSAPGKTSDISLELLIDQLIPKVEKVEVCFVRKEGTTFPEIDLKSTQEGSKELLEKMTSMFFKDHVLQTEYAVDFY